MAITPSQNSTWGPLLTTKSYILEMKGDNFYDVVFDLPGFSLAAPEADTQDAILIRTFKREGGYIVEREYIARRAFHRKYAMEIMMPPGTFWSQVKRVADAKGTCRRDFFLTALCPDDRIYGHFWRFPDAVLDQSLVQTNFVSTTDDEEFFSVGTTLHVTQQKLYYALGANEVADVSATLPLYSVAFMFDDCAECSLDAHQNAVAGGGAAGTLDALFKVTDDRFATSTDITNSLAAGSIVTDIYAAGSVIVATYADDVDTNAATATAGGVIFSTDAGVTSTVVASPTTVPFYGITAGAGRYWAVGAESKIYYSTDLTNWTEFEHSLGGATTHYTDIAYDPETSYLYISGYDGSGGVAHRINGNYIANITTDVDAGANDLYRVAVLETGHVVFGGAAGTLRENPTASDGGTYTTVSVSGTSSDIRGIVGDKARLLVGAGTNIYERSRLTEDLFSRVTNNPGTSITGDITNAAGGETYDGFNYALFVTDEAEIISTNPYFPNA